jgi:hypothetical protein
VKLIFFPPIFGDCLKILEAWTVWNPRGLSRSVRGRFNFLHLIVLVLYVLRNIN